LSSVQMFNPLYSSDHCQVVRMVYLRFMFEIIRLESQISSQALLSFQRDERMSLRWRFFTIADDPSVDGNHRAEWRCLSRCSHWCVHVLVSLPQENGVCKVSPSHLLSRNVNVSQSVHRTNSAIMTLMAYSINSGLLTRWDHAGWIHNITEPK